MLIITYNKGSKTNTHLCLHKVGISLRTHEITVFYLSILLILPIAYQNIGVHS